SSARKYRNGRNPQRTHRTTAGLNRMGTTHTPNRRSELQRTRTNLGATPDLLTHCNANNSSLIGRSPTAANTALLLVRSGKSLDSCGGLFDQMGRVSSVKAAITRRVV